MLILLGSAFSTDSEHVLARVYLDEIFNRTAYYVCVYGAGNNCRTTFAWRARTSPGGDFGRRADSSVINRADGCLESRGHRPVHEGLLGIRRIIVHLRRGSHARICGYAAAISCAISDSGEDG